MRLAYSIFMLENHASAESSKLGRRAHLTGSLWLAFGGLVLWLAALIMFWKYRKRGADTASPPREIMSSVAGTWDHGGSKTPGLTSLSRLAMNVNYLELVPPGDLIREH